jgi:hypothetical protein
MPRPSELFAITAAVLLASSFLSRFLHIQTDVSIVVHEAGYVFPPSTVFLVMASFLCFFAATYSLWPLPLNNKAAAWHYWITTAAIAAFWLCFYFFAFKAPRESGLGLYQTAALLGQFVSVIVILLAQAIFVVNLILALVRLRRLSAS